MAQKPKPARPKAPKRPKAAKAPKAPKIRVLRIGIIQGGRIIEERLIRGHRDVSVGQGPRNSFVISSANLPRTYPVFRAGAEGAYTLVFAAGMDGRVALGGHVRTLTQVREMGAAKKVGDWWHLPLEPSSRGKLVIGDVTLLFQFVQAPPAVPHARLPATIQGSMGSRMDPAFSAIMAASFAFGLGVFILFQVVPKPTTTSTPKRFRQLVKAQLHRHARRVRRPPRPARETADVKRGDDGSRAGAGRAARRVARRAANGGKGKGKRTGPLKKGTDDYRRRLSELTDISLREGSDKMRAAVIGRLTDNPNDQAISGDDPLRKGFSTGSLDQAAATASRSGEHGLGSSGPRSGRGGRRGLVGRHGGGRIGAGSGVGTGKGGAPAARRPMRVKRIKGMLSSFVPPPRIGGSAGSRIRGKIRGRVYGLRSCYNRALIDNPKLSGSVRISFIIMPNGHVSNVNVVSGMGGSIISCVRSKVGRWSLGKVPSQIFYGPFSVRFTPGG